jgi:hypothetical protein
MQLNVAFKYLVLCLILFTNLASAQGQLNRLGKDKEIVIVGETHGTLSNSKIFLEFLREYNEVVEVDAIVLEGNSIYTNLLNFYITTGNNYYLEALQNIMLDWSSSNSLSEIDSSYISGYKTLRSYYLESERKFTVYSVDSEPFQLAKYLKVFIDVNPNDSAFNRLLEPLVKVQINDSSPYISKDNFGKAEIILEKYRGEAQAYLNTKPDINKAALILSLYFNKARKSRSDKKIAENFEQLHAAFKPKTTLFWYGSLHAQKKGGWLANQLNKNYTVTSLKILYDNCYNVRLKKALSTVNVIKSTDYIYQSDTQLEIIDEVAKNDKAYDGYLLWYCH